MAGIENVERGPLMALSEKFFQSEKRDIYVNQKSKKRYSQPKFSITLQVAKHEGAYRWTGKLN
jgi:hypothetical protein